MTSQQKQNLLSLILACLILMGFIFFGFGKEISRSLSSILYTYRIYIQPAPTYPVSPTAPIGPTAPTAPSKGYIILEGEKTQYYINEQVKLK